MADAYTLPFEPAEPPRRRKRRVWPWLVTLLIVVVLLVGAAIGAEWLARGVVTGGIRTLVVQQLGLSGSEVDVEVEGIVIPQVISGTLDDVTISSPDVSLGELSGDVSVNITDMPIRADAAAGPGSAVVRLDETQLRALLATVDGFPADSVGIAAPDVTVSTDLTFFGVGIPVSAGLLPGVADGDLTLTPQRFTVGGAEVTADGLRSQFGGIADSVLRTWDICIAQYLPAALSLTGVSTEGSEVIANFDIDGAVVVDPLLRQDGTCS
ncbi:DUF2993 domain-containing protein [Microbacterium sp. P04]|uniref:LmeA family phospholipid-binding protein n=1 Tax=Microbacterium sp. P04 TaxID=3366947 RepID=UPI00374747DA